MSQFFGRFALTAGKRTYVTGLPSDGVGAIEIANDSAFSVVATLEGAGQSRNFIAGELNIMAIPPHRGFTGNLYLDPTAQLAFQNSPVNQVEINVYGIGEATPSNYPAMLPRLSNTGNDVGVQGQLKLSTNKTINGNTSGISANAGQVAYLAGFELTGSHASAQAKGVFTITGLNIAVDPGQTGLNYEIEVETGQVMEPLMRWFLTPLPSAVGGSIDFTCPALSDASMALNIYYYLP